MEIKVNMIPINASTAFPYLGRPITYNNSDWAALYINFQISQRIWGIVAKVMGNMGATIKARAMIYKALV